MIEQINSTKVALGEELLPIGSVVYIKMINQALMVYGRKQLQENNDIVWDYVACPYPQGFLTKDTNVFFQHNQITQVIYKGFESQGELIMRKKLYQLFDKENHNENN